MDTFNLMWGADNDGDPINGEFIDEPVWDDEIEYWNASAPHVVGVLLLDYPANSGEAVVSYNWWTGFTQMLEYDFGPRHKENYRDFTTGGTGQPWGDANRYHVMSNGEIDYDMVYTLSVMPNDLTWLSPPGEIALLASSKGMPTGTPNLLSVGPYDISPGDELRVPFAYVGAEDFHTDPNNMANLPYYPNRFYDNLNFTDLIRNSTWAKWIYDNPGVDTDGDDYAGEVTVCGNDTIYYTGDGVPDWRGALPPPAPTFWLEPVVNGLRVRFNGHRSETEEDFLSGRVEFEGYHVYCGFDSRASSMVLAAAYDRENYDKHVWNGELDSLIFYVLETPFSVDSLRCLYGNGCDDTLFDPAVYDIDNPYYHPDHDDSIFYFSPHGFNTCETAYYTPIKKIYPDQPDPCVYHPDSIPDDAYTEDGYLKFYEYEFVIDNLLPTVAHYVNVTAFDYGNPDLGFAGLESPLVAGMKSAYPLGPSDVVAGKSSQVYVYPNPYRGDAGYRDLGFEGRLQEDRPDYRVREIHFANLPSKCRISIYTIDGDLVRTLEHDMDPSDPNSNRETWNLISRNTQLVVTGLYYWVVEAEDGSTQMGKLVIIF